MIAEWVRYLKAVWLTSPGAAIRHLDEYAEKQREIERDLVKLSSRIDPLADLVASLRDPTTRRNQHHDNGRG